MSTPAETQLGAATLVAQLFESLATQLRQAVETTAVTELVTAALEDLCQEKVRGYRIETVAKLLDLPESTVRTLNDAGVFGHVTKAGRYWLIPHSGLAQYLADVAAGKYPATESA